MGGVPGVAAVVRVGAEAAAGHIEIAKAIKVLVIRGKLSMFKKLYTFKLINIKMFIKYIYEN